MTTIEESPTRTAGHPGARDRLPDRRGRRAMRRPVVVLALLMVTVVPGTGTSAAAASVDSWPSGTASPGNATVNPGESILTPATAARVTQAWVTKEQIGTQTAPSVVNGVVYYFDNPSLAGNSSQLIAASARTGGRLWSLTLPAVQNYPDGMTVVGDMAVMAYGGWTQRAGITAVNLRTHTIAWNRPLADLPPEYSWVAPGISGHVTADSQRVYIAGGSTNLAAFRLTDGAPLWSQPMSSPLLVSDFALGDGVIYGTTRGTTRPVLTAYSAATGRPLWSAPGAGLPVVAGNRVFTATAAGVTAVAAGGCGQSVCPALWTRAIHGYLPAPAGIGGADGQTLFAVYSSTSADQSVVVRLSAATGAVLWKTSGGAGVVGPPVRGGNVLWMLTVAPFTDPGLGFTYRLQAFAATGTRTSPLRTMTQAPGLGNASEAIAVAAGTVLVQAWPKTLTAYRIPGR